MEWLERLTPRRIALLLALAAAVRFGLPYYQYPLAWYTRWRYPSVGAAPSAGSDIEADGERREAGRVEARYRRVLAQLEQARADGFDTSKLENKARAAMQLNVKEYRRSCVRMLGEVEMSVPRKRVQYIPMGPTQAPGEDIEPDAPAKPVAEAPKPKAKSKARRKRRTR